MDTCLGSPLFVVSQVFVKDFDQSVFIMFEY